MFEPLFLLYMPASGLSSNFTGLPPTSPLNRHIVFLLPSLLKHIRIHHLSHYSTDSPIPCLRNPSHLFSTATPLSVLPAVLLSALPPILCKAINKIQSGQFLNFKGLLVDNIEFPQKLKETRESSQGTSSKLQNIQELLSFLGVLLSVIYA